MNWIAFLFIVNLSIHSQPLTQVSTPPDSAPVFLGDTTFQGALEDAHIELLEIDGNGSFSRQNIAAGDTLSYTITVEWKNPKVPIAVLAPESLSFVGFKRVKSFTSHKKIAKMVDGKPVVKNRSVFVYNLKAKIPGSGKAGTARLPYYSAVRKEQEYLTISPQLIDISKAVIPLNQRWYIKLFLWILLAGLVLVMGRWALKTFKKSDSDKNKQHSQSLEQSLKEVKSRIGSAESRELLLEMESLAVRYLADTLGSTGNHFDTLLADYKTKTEAKDFEKWATLKDEFNLAKFGDGNRASHELLESYKLLSQCLHQNEDINDHN